MLAPALPVAVPLAAAALLAALNELISRKISSAIAMGATAVAGGATWMLLRASRAEPIVYWFGGWQPSHGAAIGISFVIDPFGAGLALFGCVLVLAGLVYSARYFDTVGNIYHVLMLAFLGAVCGFCLTGDLFNLFVFFELMGAAAFALCGYKSEDPTSLEGALNFAVTNTIGAFLVLSGIALLYGRTGALNLAQIGRSLGTRADGLVVAAFAFITAGFLVKAAVVPFHFWLPDAHAVAPAPACILFSGIMVELGLYAVARVYWTVFPASIGAHSTALRNILTGGGTLTALLGAGMCYAQRHIKRLLAFSTVSHMGLLMIGFGLLDPDGLSGAAIYVLGHGFVKAALFLGAGILLHRTGSVDEIDLHGRGRNLPWTGMLFAVGAAGLAGCPGFATFTGDRLMADAARRVGCGWVGWIAFAAEVLTAAAVLRMAGRVFLGWGPAQDAFPRRGSHVFEEPDTRGGRDHTPASMFAPALALLALGFVQFVPGLVPGARQVAGWFQNRPAYAARVMDGVAPALPVARSHAPDAFDYGRGIASVVAASGLAWLTLFSSRLRQAFSGSPVVQGVVHGLRRVHSGIIPDYVTWLTLGVAVLAALSAACLRT